MIDAIHAFATKRWMRAEPVMTVAPPSLGIAFLLRSKTAHGIGLTRAPRDPGVSTDPVPRTAHLARRTDSLPSRTSTRSLRERYVTKVVICRRIAPMTALRASAHG